MRVNRRIHIEPHREPPRRPYSRLAKTSAFIGGAGFVTSCETLKGWPRILLAFLSLQFFAPIIGEWLGRKHDSPK